MVLPRFGEGLGMALGQDMRAVLRGAILLPILTLMAITGASAQGDEEGLPTIAEKTEGFEVIEGLFNFYQDPEDGSLLMEVGADQLREEFIAFTYAENGVIEAGTFRGAYRDTRIISFEKHYGSLELSEINTSFYFDETKAISNAADANISPALIGKVGIIAETPGEGDDAARYLISGNDIFLTEVLHQVTPTASPFAGLFGFQVGGLSYNKTKYDKISAYPENIDVRVDYIFDNPMPINSGSAAVTDARSVQLKIQHTIMTMPEEGFEPRYDDYRVGYFLDQVTDLSIDSATPYRDLINRWRLVKKDPGAAISDPVKPITFWIENTTPREWRDAVREGTLAWNEAFEAAGFSNAVEVKIQPDDAEWDAGDIRYNVIRWTSSPTPPFLGYGPSFTNPRTGEILGADVMLEFAYLQRNQSLSDVFDLSGLSFETAAEEPSAKEVHTHSHAHRHGKHHHHSHGTEIRANLGFSVATLQTQGVPESEQQEMMRQSVAHLVMHEVGHTLGLNHNMKASTVFSPEELQDKSITQGAPSGSVMDYQATNIAPLGGTQGDYQHTRPGPYDLWAIEFGYSPDIDDPEKRASLLARSSEAALTFGNDADDMRSPANGIDPRVMTWDQSSDPIQYSVDRIKLVRSILPSLLDEYEGEDSYQELLMRYLVLSAQHATSARTISKWVGGVFVERVEPGQDDTVPYTPVPKATQKRAMEELAEHVFAADAFELPEDLLQHLQRQRRGFNFFFRTEDPKLHARALGVQMSVMRQLLHPNTLERLTDSALYGNDYSAAEMILDLNDAVFGNDLMGVPNTYRRNLQIAYTERLVVIADSFGYDPIAESAALAGLQDIKRRFGFIPDFVLPVETRAHRAAIRKAMAS